MTHIFMGGLPENRYRGMKCTIGWIASDGKYCVVYFDKEEVERKNLGLSYEWAKLDDLKEIK